MFHTLAWFENITDVVFANIDPVQDNIFTIQNDRFVPQIDYTLLYGAAFGADLDQARLNSPTFRQFSPKNLLPVQVAALPADNVPIVDFRGSPLSVKGLEEFSLEAQDAGAIAADVHAVIGLTDRPESAPIGDTYTLRGTSTTASVADVWQQIAITWDDTLPAGSYVCVGLVHICTSGIAARIIFENQVHRPGCVSQVSVAVKGDPMFRNAALGRWGQFTSNRFPNIEVFTNAAIAVHTVFLDFIRIG